MLTSISIQPQGGGSSSSTSSLHRNASSSTHASPRRSTLTHSSSNASNISHASNTSGTHSLSYPRPNWDRAGISSILPSLPFQSLFGTEDTLSRLKRKKKAQRMLEEKERQESVIHAEEEDIKRRGNVVQQTKKGSGSGVGVLGVVVGTTQPDSSYRMVEASTTSSSAAQDSDSAATGEDTEVSLITSSSSAHSRSKPTLLNAVTRVLLRQSVHASRSALPNANTVLVSPPGSRPVTKQTLGGTSTKVGGIAELIAAKTREDDGTTVDGTNNEDLLDANAKSSSLIDATRIHGTFLEHSSRLYHTHGASALQAHHHANHGSHNLESYVRQKHDTKRDVKKNMEAWLRVRMRRHAKRLKEEDRLRAREMFDMLLLAAGPGSSIGGGGGTTGIAAGGATSSQDDPSSAQIELESMRRALKNLGMDTTLDELAFRLTKLSEHQKTMRANAVAGIGGTSSGGAVTKRGTAANAGGLSHTASTASLLHHSSSSNTLASSASSATLPTNSSSSSSSSSPSLPTLHLNFNDFLSIYEHLSQWDELATYKKLKQLKAEEEKRKMMEKMSPRHLQHTRSKRSLKHSESNVSNMTVESMDTTTLTPRMKRIFGKEKQFDTSTAADGTTTDTTTSSNLRRTTAPAGLSMTMSIESPSGQMRKLDVTTSDTGLMSSTSTSNLIAGAASVPSSPSSSSQPPLTKTDSSLRSIELPFFLWVPAAHRAERINELVRLYGQPSMVGVGVGVGGEEEKDPAANLGTAASAPNSSRIIKSLNKSSSTTKSGSLTSRPHKRTSKHTASHRRSSLDRNGDSSSSSNSDSDNDDPLHPSSQQQLEIPPSNILRTLVDELNPNKIGTKEQNAAIAKTISSLLPSIVLSTQNAAAAAKDNAESKEKEGKESVKDLTGGTVSSTLKAAKKVSSSSASTKQLRTTAKGSSGTKSSNVLTSSPLSTVPIHPHMTMTGGLGSPTSGSGGGSTSGLPGSYWGSQQVLRSLHFKNMSLSSSTLQQTRVLTHETSGTAPALTTPVAAVASQSISSIPPSPLSVSRSNTHTTPSKSNNGSRRPSLFVTPIAPAASIPVNAGGKSLVGEVIPEVEVNENSNQDDDSTSATTSTTSARTVSTPIRLIQEEMHRRAEQTALEIAELVKEVEAKLSGGGRSSTSQNSGSGQDNMNSSTVDHDRHKSVSSSTTTDSTHPSPPQSSTTVAPSSVSSSTTKKSPLLKRTSMSNSNNNNNSDSNSTSNITVTISPIAPSMKDGNSKKTLTIDPTPHPPNLAPAAAPAPLMSPREIARARADSSTTTTSTIGASGTSSFRKTAHTTSSDDPADKPEIMSLTDPMIKAAKSGAWEDVLMLIQTSAGENIKLRNAYVNRRDKNGSTAIFHCVWIPHYKVLEVLLYHGADPNIQNNRLNTALHLCCEKGHRKLIRLLIEMNASIDVKNWQNKTCLDVIPTGDEMEGFESQQAAEKKAIADGNVIVPAGSTSAPEPSAAALMGAMRTHAANDATDSLRTFITECALEQHKKKEAERMELAQFNGFSTMHHPVGSPTAMNENFNFVEYATKRDAAAAATRTAASVAAASLSLLGPDGRPAVDLWELTAADRRSAGIRGNAFGANALQRTNLGSGQATNQARTLTGQLLIHTGTQANTGLSANQNAMGAYKASFTSMNDPVALETRARIVAGLVREELAHSSLHELWQKTQRVVQGRATIISNTDDLLRVNGSRMEELRKTQYEREEKVALHYAQGHHVAHSIMGNATHDSSSISIQSVTEMK